MVVLFDNLTSGFLTKIGRDSIRSMAFTGDQGLIEIFASIAAFDVSGKMLKSSKLSIE